MREPRRFLALLAVLALIGVLTSACGGSGTTSGHLQVTQLASDSSGDISLTSGWVLAPEGSEMADMPGMDHTTDPMVAAYATFHNGADRPDAIVKVLAPAGARAQLHTTTSTGTSGSMQPVSRLVVPAGAELTLEPGGDHVMLTGLHPVPTAGSTVRLTFVMRSGARLAVTLPVIAAADRPAS